MCCRYAHNIECLQPWISITIAAVSLVSMADACRSRRAAPAAHCNCACLQIYDRRHEAHKLLGYVLASSERVQEDIHATNGLSFHLRPILHSVRSLRVLACRVAIGCPHAASAYAYLSRPVFLAHVANKRPYDMHQPAGILYAS